MTTNPKPPDDAILMYIYARDLKRIVSTKMTKDEFWKEAQGVCEVVANHRREQDPFGHYLQRLQTEYLLFPAEFWRKLWRVEPAENVEDGEYMISNYGACNFLVKPDGKMRKSRNDGDVRGGRGPDERRLLHAILHDGQREALLEHHLQRRRH